MGLCRRKTIGPVYADYPARKVGAWFGDKLLKIISSVACVAIWCGVYWVLLGVVNFNKNTFLEGATQTTVNELFCTDWSLTVLAISSVIITFWVFRNRTGSRKKRKQ